MKPNDKRYIENMRVKKSIQTALFSLITMKNMMARDIRMV